ncbi:MAG: ABC transporter substrate-binding protein [Acidimicrobiales bacterium]
MTVIVMIMGVVVLGILAALVVFAVSGDDDDGQQASNTIDDGAIKVAQEAYCTKNGSFGTEKQLVDGGFLKAESTAFDVTLSSGGTCDRAGNANATAFKVSCAPDTSCGPSAKPVLGGILVVENGTGAPGTALNHSINTASSVVINDADMFNGLLRYELDGSLGGDLAQSFKVDNAVPRERNPNCVNATCDAMTSVATFVLRPGVKFHGVDASRPGDGDILDPDDVEFSFSKAILAAHSRTRALNPALGVTGQATRTVVPPDAIQTLPPTAGNGGTVIFNLRQVFAPFPFALTVTEAPIISETAYGPCFEDGSLFNIAPATPLCPANTSPVGTGPFRFQSLTPEGVRTVKNPDYFRFDAAGNRLPYLDGMFKKTVAGSATTALESREVDVATVSLADIPRLGDDLNYDVAFPRSTNILTIGFNMTKRQEGSATAAPPPPGGQSAIGLPPSQGGYPESSPYYGQNKPGSNENAPPHKILGDSRVREAIFKAIDRNKIWTDVQFKTGRVADAPIHSSFALPNGGAYQGPQPVPQFNRTEAGSLLSAAGWSDTSNSDGFRRALNHPNKNNPDPDLVVPDGTKLAMEYLHAEGGEEMAAEVKSQLKTIGIDITTFSVNNGTVLAPRVFHARTFDLAQYSNNNGAEPQFGARRLVHTDQVTQSNSFANASGYKSTVMDQLWVDASKAPDTATYQAKFLQIQRMILGQATTGGPALTPLETSQKFPVVHLVESVNTRATLSTCTGFNHGDTGLYMEAAHCKKA